MFTQHRFQLKSENFLYNPPFHLHSNSAPENKLFKAAFKVHVFENDTITVSL